jgi:carboxyl-terminal processing protease
MSKILKVISAIFVLALVFSSGVGSGIIVDRQISRMTNQANTQQDQGLNYSLIQEAWKTINQVYVDRTVVNQQNLTYGAISGMVTALGDTGHSTFLTPEMVKSEHNFTQGEFEGIGALLEMRNGHATIVTPFDGSPAQKAGVKPGDVILKVDGKDVSGQSLTQIVDQVLGPAGTKVTLTLQDPNTGTSRDVTITRAKIQIHNVTWHMLPGTTLAHVRVAAFSDGVTDDLKKALQEAKAQGATGIILDLRNDPGGLLSEAVSVASQFLSGGNVMLEKNAQGQTKPLPVEKGGEATDIPMVVLINNGTASAAEIVSGALQDAKRATLIGETTFGTGTVLNEYPLSDGSSLLLATEEWLTPNGKSFWHKGIQPDIQVSLPANVSPLIPEQEQGMTAQQIQDSQDAQLLKGIQTLQQSGSKP